MVSRGALDFLGPEAGMTLVSMPVNGEPGVLAYRGRELAAILVFKVRDGRIYDIHGAADPRKSRFAGGRLPARYRRQDG